MDYGVKGRLKSIMPHGDICKGKISSQRCLHVVFLNRYYHVDFTLMFICVLHALYRLNSLVQQIANYAYALLSTICMHIFRGSLVYIMRESNFVIHFSLYTKDHEI